MIILLIGIVSIGVTVALHAITTSIVVRLLQVHAVRAHHRFGRRARPYILGLVSMCLAVKHYFDIFLWALVYIVFASADGIDTFESALYFSSVTYTALGYGDIVLLGPWRLLCGIQAMNGILLFGWSTALLFLLVQRLWKTDIKNELPHGLINTNSAQEQ